MDDEILTPRCRYCNNPIFNRSKQSRYCSDNCSARRRKGMPAGGENLPKGTIGAVAELAVCADLLQLGFEVFRAVSPCSTCDLVVSREGEPCVRVEVKSGWEKEGRLFLPTASSRNRFDVMAIYMRNSGVIIYKPPFKE